MLSTSYVSGALNCQIQPLSDWAQTYPNIVTSGQIDQAPIRNGTSEMLPRSVHAVSAGNVDVLECR